MKKLNSQYYNLFFVTIILSLIWLTGCGGGSGGDGGVVPDVPTATPVPAQPTGDITVRVCESDEFTPVVGAFVAFYTYSIDNGRSVPDLTSVTDSNGEVNFTGVPQGACRIEAWRNEASYQHNENPLGTVEGNVGAGVTLRVVAGTIEPTATPTPVPTSAPTPVPTSPSGTTPTPYWRSGGKVNDGANGGSGACTGADSSGNACALWVDYRNEIMGDIYSSYRPSGGAWQENKRVDDCGAGTWVSSPDVAVDVNGNTYAVWGDARSGNNWDIYFSHTISGGDWSANERVDNGVGDSNVWYPSIAVDSSGNLYAVWKDERGGDSDIYFSYRPSGGTWQPDVRVDSGGTSTAGSPDITVDSNGNIYVVWEDYRNGNFDIYFSSSSSPAGPWSSDERIDNGPSNKNAYGPVIGSDSYGNLYCVWRDYRDALDLYFSYRLFGENWSYNERVNTSGSTHYPAIAVDPSGNSHLAWHDGSSGNKDIYYSYRPSGSYWGTGERIDDDTEGHNAEQPAIAATASGHIYVVWQDDRSGTYEIYSAVKE